MGKCRYEIPLLEVFLVGSADVIATSGLDVSTMDGEKGYGPLIPVGKK